MYLSKTQITQNRVFEMTGSKTRWQMNIIHFNEVLISKYVYFGATENLVDIYQ